MNVDQTRLNLTPVGNKTFVEKGFKQVLLRYLKDKRQITILLAGTASGILLPLQLIFEGIDFFKNFTL